MTRDQIVSKLSHLLSEPVIDRAAVEALRRELLAEDPGKLDTALSAWARWFSAKHERIAAQREFKEGIGGAEQDLFEALGCYVAPEPPKGNPCCGNVGTHGEGRHEYCSTCGAELGARGSVG